MIQAYAAISVGLLAFFGVLIGHVISNFLAEDYRRHLDATALAAAFAGELRGHFDGGLALNPVLLWLKDELDAGRLPEGNFRGIQDVGDPLFEANASKVGLLGPILAARTAYVYQKLSGFRLGLKVLCVSWHEMSPTEKKTRLKGLLTLLEEANTTGRLAVADLTAFSQTGTLAGWWRKLRHVSPVSPECAS